MTHILSFTTLYPSRTHPAFGIFVENRLRAYREANPFDTLRVMAPQRWFAGLPKHEIRHGIEVYRPRWFSIPLMSAYTADQLLYRCSVQAMYEYIDEHGKPDVIDAHYLYPDGVAAAHLAKRFNIPFVLTARGSDVTYWLKLARPKTLITNALKKAYYTITVCQALQHQLLELVPTISSITLRNGIDTRLYYPVADDMRMQYRQKYRMRGTVLLSVGHLIPRKGHDLVIGALQHLRSDVSLHIVGTGPMQAKLHKVAKKYGKRVVFHGAIAPEQMPELYNAADILVLASHNEGMANVLLEAQACGTPVVACAIDGTPEVVSLSLGGLFELKHRNAKGIAKTVRQLLQQMPSRHDVAYHGQTFIWEKTTVGMKQCFSNASI